MVKEIILIKSSHVLPTLIKKFIKAKLKIFDKEVEVWGSGKVIKRIFN